MGGDDLARARAAVAGTMSDFHVPAHPGASSPAVSRRMSVAARRDTGCELGLRRLLHAAGLRYRVSYPVPGNRRRSIDVAFTGAKVAVFVDGCFWHGCPEHGTQPRANSAWWTAKLSANRARDADTTALLEAVGWTVVRVWEHTDPAEAAALVERTVRTVRPGRQPGPARGRRATRPEGASRSR